MQKGCSKSFYHLVHIQCLWFISNETPAHSELLNSKLETANSNKKTLELYLRQTLWHVEDEAFF